MVHHSRNSFLLSLHSHIPPSPQALATTFLSSTATVLSSRECHIIELDMV